MSLCLSLGFLVGFNLPYVLDGWGCFLCVTCRGEQGMNCIGHVNRIQSWRPVVIFAHKRSSFNKPWSLTL